MKFLWMKRSTAEEEIAHHKAEADVLHHYVENAQASRDYWMQRALDAEANISMILSNTDQLGVK